MQRNRSAHTACVHAWPSKSLKGSKLRRTLNLTFSKTGLKLHTKKAIEYATNTYKKYFHPFRINQIIFAYGKKKNERSNCYGMFGQNLPISAAFTPILKMELPQCNAIGVRTPPAYMRDLCVTLSLSKTVA